MTLERDWNINKHGKNPKVVLPNGNKGTVSGGPGPIASVVKVHHSDGGYHLETHNNSKLELDQ